MTVLFYTYARNKIAQQKSYVWQKNRFIQVQ